MINEPVQVVSEGFQLAWLEVTRRLAESYWELRNVVVHIKRPGAMDIAFNETVTAFARAQRLLTPKQVAYTIFPHKLYQRVGNASSLFSDYDRRLYPKIKRLQPKIANSWGNYFRRMTNYESATGPVNQLQNIIDAIQNRQRLSSAAYTIVIQKPGTETVRPRGGPCLNYIAIQAEASWGGNRTIGLLAVYRNHEFLERAYGNYWGLCNLLIFLAAEVGGTPGPLTCVSSRAYVRGNKTALNALIGRL